MPKRAHVGNDVATPKPKKKGPRVAANGHKLPEPLPNGEILTDVKKNTWRLGKSVGLGGFGEIYLASNVTSKAVGPDAPFVVKVEHHHNGPLFAEMHCYHRIGKEDSINEWVAKKKLDYLGMPRFVASGSHEFKGVKYRFMIMDRFGEDLQKLLLQCDKVFPVKTVYTLGMRIIDILEYVHNFSYIHADVKASNLLLGFGKGNENKVYLVDFGLACKYITNGKHKEYKEDLRKAHDGTIEFTSRDAHIGTHSRRGDLEILGYNMLQWLCGKLPWEDSLKEPELVHQKKTLFMRDIPHLMDKSFNSKPFPAGISEFLQMIADMAFDETPNYERLKKVLKAGIKKAGFTDNGSLSFVAPPKLKSPKLGRRALNHSPEKPAKASSDKIVSKSPRQKNLGRKASSAASTFQNKSNDTNSSPLLAYSNPTPAMLEVMQKCFLNQNSQTDDRKRNHKKYSSSESSSEESLFSAVVMKANSKNKSKNSTAKVTTVSRGTQTPSPRRKNSRNKDEW